MKALVRFIGVLFAIGSLVACAASPQQPVVQTVVVPQTVVATTRSGVPRLAATHAARSSPTNAPIIANVTPSAAVPVSQTIRYVDGSTQKVCQLTGETDREFNQPTVNQTETRFGLVGNDLGYSFEHDGKLFFLFGDTSATPRFNDKPNGYRDPPRTLDDNDAIAFTTDTSVDSCLKLDFIQHPNGAFKNPMVLNAQDQPAITLRVDEVPIAGISDGGKMFVVFATDNYAYPPGPTKGHLGFATRSVAGVSDDDAKTFHYLYDFSEGPDARFINVAIARGQDGYLYFWGTQGGTLYRKSAPFLARKAVGSMSDLNPIEYLQALNPDGSPVFTHNESAAVPLFHDYAANATGQNQINDCMGELGVEWNPFLKRWVMLYNCLNNTPANPRGIYMRLAEQPWGPWSAPQTIFNPVRDKGYCYFIHRAVDTQNPTPCDNLSAPGNVGEWGGEYAPYFISRFTMGDAARGTSTFYYTLSTWIPYTEVIMKSTIQVVP